jgi:phosphate transport system substrate-binding protein
MIMLAAASTAAVLVLSGCSSSNKNSASPSTSTNCATGSIKGSGSTAQKNAMAVWVSKYQTQCVGSTINYSGTGSAAGVTDFINNQVAFAGSDSAIKDSDLTSATARCASGAAINIPMVGGAIAIAYNVPGVTKLILNPDVTAGIFNNTITKWNDPKIAALNPGVTLPSASIAAFHRSDGSGTTKNFTAWLNAAAPTVWTNAAAKEWPLSSGGQGAKGSDGVTSGIKSTTNSIGYIELSFVQTSGLSAAEVDQGGGPVAPSSASATAALAQAKLNSDGNNNTLSIDYTTTAAGAYPVVLVTYEITCDKGLPADQVPLVKSFFTYTASATGQAELNAIGYVPMPDNVITAARSAISAIS